MVFKTDDSFLEKLFEITRELYIYCHLRIHTSKDDAETEQDIATIIMIILIVIFSFTAIKVIIIFVNFLLINIIINILKYFKESIKKRCRINLVREFKIIFLYFNRIFKKFYTYNFYSYESKVYGFFMVSTYVTFVVFNILFATFYALSDKTDDDLSLTVKIWQIISFEVSIFMELICAFFYLIRNSKKHTKTVIICFIILNIVIFSVMYLKQYLLLENDNDDLRRIANLLFCCFFTFIYILAYKKTFDYNVRCIFF